MLRRLLYTFSLVIFTNKVGAISGPLLGKDKLIDQSCQVKISYVENNTYTICSASIISPNQLLSAAHCYDDIKEGDKIEVSCPKEKRIVTHYHIHPNYIKNINNDDQAVIYVNKAFETTPIEIPENK